jgi:fumarate reductase iron-sulfur subunit
MDETPAKDNGRLRVAIWRGRAEGAYWAYDVPQRANQTVLDVVTWVQRHAEPTLAYRFACRVGVCGSCAMTVNGRPRWTCRTHVGKVAQDGKLTLGPLANLPVVRDLVTDMAPFFDKWQAAGGRFQGRRTRADTVATLTPPPLDTDATESQCINCGVCNAACGVLRRRADYLGPAALNRAWELVNDPRHDDVQGLLQATMADGGCHACHSHGSCTEHCPIGLQPSAAIAGLKRWTLAGLLRGYAV